MSARKQWTDAQLYDLSGCVERRMTWTQIAAEYQMSVKWVRRVYHAYLHRVTKDTFKHWTPPRLMNLYLERKRGAGVDTLAEQYQSNPMEIHKLLGEARRLVEGVQ